MIPRIAAFLLIAWTSLRPAGAAEWQVVLLKPPGCGYCTYVEEILKRRGQLRQVVLDDGAGGSVTAPVERRPSAELSDPEWSQLRTLPWFDEAQWRRQAAARAAQILLKRDGTIVAAGDIGESADLRSARFPAEITTPNTGLDPRIVRAAASSFLSDLYLRSWNLDWFYQLALDPSLLDRRAGTPWIAPGGSEMLTPALGATNVLLMSTATGAADNEIFNALRIEEIRGVLTGPGGLAPEPPRIFYGSDSAYGANALEVRGGRTDLVRRDVEGASPATPDAVQRIFESIRARPGSRNLMVLIGHGGPDGAGMWGSPEPLSPATLRALHEHGGGDDVLVSGNCFGGVMARAMSCGFFGARPDIIATGCQADAAQVAQSRDYLHMFFQSLTPAALASADADADRDISFAEAHWYASTAGDERNVTYSSIDALADAWFDANSARLPASLSVRELLDIAKDAPPAEAQALRRLLSGFAADITVRLRDLAGQAARWRPASGMPRAMAGQLARRLLFRREAGGQRPELAQLEQCENRSVAAFLEPP